MNTLSNLGSGENDLIQNELSSAEKKHLVNLAKGKLSESIAIDWTKYFDGEHQRDCTDDLRFCVMWSPKNDKFRHRVVLERLNAQKNGNKLELVNDTSSLVLCLEVPLD